MVPSASIVSSMLLVLMSSAMLTGAPELMKLEKST